MKAKLWDVGTEDGELMWLLSIVDMDEWIAEKNKPEQNDEIEIKKR